MRYPLSCFDLHWSKFIDFMHMARHTFAVFALNNGVRIEVVSKMLAHADIKTTQIYAKILQKEVEAGFDLLEEKLSGGNHAK
jgi:integrase